MKQTDTGKKMSKVEEMSNCIPQETIIENVRLAAAYVPFQFLCAVFTPIEALRRGTAFPELYSPYKGEDKKSRPCQLETIKKGRI
ncbi:MAG: spore coat associated protein CotJA [Clostridium sp.]|uniref:spore coat associated protein CotJA n=1 Tax=Clostridium sp. TaxID=1506 RepID=UPI003D6CEC2F